MYVENGEKERDLYGARELFCQWNYKTEVFCSVSSEIINIIIYTFVCEAVTA